MTQQEVTVVFWSGMDRWKRHPNAIQVWLRGNRILRMTPIDTIPEGVVIIPIRKRDLEAFRKTGNLGYIATQEGTRGMDDAAPSPVSPQNLTP